MIHKIGNVKDVDAVSNITESEKQVVCKYANILTEEYGEDRDVDRDYGGYILFCEKGTTIDEIKDKFDYDEFVLEYAELFEEDVCAAIYLTSTEYAVVLVMSLADTPDSIREAIPKKEYKIRISEVLSSEVEVEALTKYEAMIKVKEKYNACEFILTADAFSGVSFEEVE